MDFLKEYGIKDEVINQMLKSYDQVLIDVFLFDEANVRKVIEYFQVLGIKVIDDLLLYRIEIFSIDVEKLKKSISRFDQQELIRRINEDYNTINCL